MRFPAVAGSFYSSVQESLKRQVVAYLNEAKNGMKTGQEKDGKTPQGKERESSQEKEKKLLPEEKKSCQASPFAAVVPHAGYVYSGKTAAYSFVALEEKLKLKNTTVIIVGPNHTGQGRAPASVSYESWVTPAGKSETDIEVAAAIEKECKLAGKDEIAHMYEHSIEVQLPFLQIINPVAKVVCIALNMQEGQVIEPLANAVAKVVADKKFANRNFVLLASSDFTHYESGDSAKAKDMPEIGKIIGFDSVGFMEDVEANNLSICGAGPIACVAQAAKQLGATRAELLRYTNSGEEYGSDDGRVVAYASIAFYK